jgi:hypothetical protein
MSAAPRAAVCSLAIPLAVAEVADSSTMALTDAR